MPCGIRISTRSAAGRRSTRRCRCLNPDGIVQRHDCHAGRQTVLPAFLSTAADSVITSAALASSMSPVWQIIGCLDDSRPWRPAAGSQRSIYTCPDCSTDGHVLGSLAPE